MTIADAIRQLAGKGSMQQLVCTVVERNGFTCTCQPLDGSTAIPDVRIVAHDEKDGFVLIPAVGSIVVVAMLNDKAGLVVMQSEVEEVYWKAGNTTYSATAAGHLIKKGNDTLKQALTLMIEAVQKIVVLQGTNPDYAKLQQALNKVNNILR